METTKQLRERMQDRSRAARHLLNENGARAWTPIQQSAFDALLADHERAQEVLDARLSEDNVLAAIQAEQRSGLNIFLRKASKERSDSDLKLIRNTMSTTTGSQGGYAVGTLVAPEIINLIKAYGFMRQVAQQFSTAKGGPGSFSASDGTTEVGEQVAENVIAASLDTSFATVDLPTYRFSSKIFTLPIELVQDSAVDLIQFVVLRARERIGRIQNQRFTTGTGTGQPTGLVTAATIGKTGTTGQTITITYDDLVDVVSSVDVAHLGIPDSAPDAPKTAPGWMFGKTMRGVIRKLKDTNGRPIWTPSYDDGMAPPQRAQLLDYPVYINDDMPSPAANAKSLAFGNLHAYVIRDALDVLLFRFDDSGFASKGQVGFLAFARSGGNLTDSGAVKLYQHSAT